LDGVGFAGGLGSEVAEGLATTTTTEIPIASRLMHSMIDILKRNTAPTSETVPDKLPEYEQRVLCPQNTNCYVQQQPIIRRRQQADDTPTFTDRWNSGDIGSRLTDNLMDKLVPHIDKALSQQQQQQRPEDVNFWQGLINQFAEARAINEDGQSKGAYVGLPFLPPFYVGGYSDNRLGLNTNERHE
jgi:hypothetical protein